MIRVAKMVFLANGVFVPYRKQVVLTKNGENDGSFYPQKQGVALLRARKTDENDENGGCPSDKTRGLPKTGFSPP